MAVIEIGVSCRFSSTLRAVTVISSRVFASCCCAYVGLESAAAPASTSAWPIFLEVAVASDIFFMGLPLATDELPMTLGAKRVIFNRVD